MKPHLEGSSEEQYDLVLQTKTGAYADRERVPRFADRQVIAGDMLSWVEFQRLRALTNLRVIADSNTDTGYRIDYALFPGWEKVPEW